MSRDKLFHTGIRNAHSSFQCQQVYVVRVAVSQSKRIEMGLKGIETSSLQSEVYIKITFVRIEMSGDKLFVAGNSHTSFQFQKMYAVRVSVSHSKRVEMGLKSIETT